MPRFGAEGIPSALAEQMWKQELNRQMFDSRPQTSPNEFGTLPPYTGQFDPQSSPLMPPPNIDTLMRNQFRRVNPGPYDPVYRNEKFNDTKTMDQSAREDRDFGTAMAESRLHTFRPEQRNDPGSADPFRSFPMPRGMGRSTMDELYTQMPDQPIPGYPMTVIPPNAEMQQLMSFYTNEDI